MFNRTICVREGNPTGLSWQWLRKLLAISPFVAASTIVVDQKPVFAGQGGVQYEVGGFYWTARVPNIVNSGREEQGSVSA